MAGTDPILSLSNVRCPDLLARSAGALELSLQPGDLALVDARDPTLATGFADLCCGLQQTTEGEVHFLQRNWARQTLEMADALRGLIGRVMARPGWLPFLDAGTNIMLQQLHHTRTGIVALREEGACLAREFGLPGLPTGSIDELSAIDLLRAGFVRAFLGAPRLVILESPVQGLHRDLVPPLLNQLSEVRDRGGAAIWLTRSRLVWDSSIFPATYRLRLGYHGLASERRAA